MFVSSIRYLAILLIFATAYLPVNGLDEKKDPGHESKPVAVGIVGNVTLSKNDTDVTVTSKSSEVQSIKDNKSDPKSQNDGIPVVPKADDESSKVDPPQGSNKNPSTTVSTVATKSTTDITIPSDPTINNTETETEATNPTEATVAPVSSSSYATTIEVSSNTNSITSSESTSENTPSSSSTIVPPISENATSSVATVTAESTSQAPTTPESNEASKPTSTTEKIVPSDEPGSEVTAEIKKEQGLSSGVIALVMAIVFAIVVVFVYVGLLLWRRYLEYRYGNRELLVNDLEFDTNDLRHFEL